MRARALLNAYSLYSLNASIKDSFENETIDGTIGNCGENSTVGIEKVQNCSVNHIENNLEIHSPGKTIFDSGRNIVEEKSGVEIVVEDGSFPVSCEDLFGKRKDFGEKVRYFNEHYEEMKNFWIPSLQKCQSCTQYYDCSLVEVHDDLFKELKEDPLKFTKLERLRKRDVLKYTIIKRIKCLNKRRYLSQKLGFKVFKCEFNPSKNRGYNYSQMKLC